MSQEKALLIGNVIAGFHTMIIFFFFIGWLVPFMSFWKRCLLNGVIGLLFLFFGFLGSCPLTAWEKKFRAIANPDVYYGTSFISRNIKLAGFTINDSSLKVFSLFLTFFIVAINICYLFWTFKKRSK